MAPHTARCIDPQLGAEKKEVFSRYSGISLTSLTNMTFAVCFLPYNVTVWIHSYLLCCYAIRYLLEGLDLGLTLNLLNIRE